MRPAKGPLGPEDSRPSAGLGTVLPKDYCVDVIVPVYGALAETRRCIESVLQTRHLNRGFGRLILVDDGSPERELRDYLADVAKQDGVFLLTNAANMGFVVSINRGMAAGDSDVILLNSDTEVSGNWLDRLALQALADVRIATVTPFSNNATILCSYPDPKGQPTLLPGLSLEDVDRACIKANAGRAIDLPSAVGFCMFVKRACLAEVGAFDEAAFGKGYGEEVDFCQRALGRGWRHVLAGDVFVFHAGGASFADPTGEKKAKGHALLRKRHPTYDSQVTCWAKNDPALPLRASVTAALVGKSGLPQTTLHAIRENGVGRLEKENAALKKLLGESETDRAERLKIIQIQEKDAINHIGQIQSLTKWLNEANAVRAAQLALIEKLDADRIVQLAAMDKMQQDAINHVGQIQSLTKWINEANDAKAAQIALIDKLQADLSAKIENDETTKRALQQVSQDLNSPRRLLRRLFDIMVARMRQLLAGW